MSNHTPGPWNVGPCFDNFGEPEIIIEKQTDAGNLVVAVALAGLQGQEANARLIAAAPDLLDALKYVLEDDCFVPRANSATRIVVRAAIAKATGEQT